MMVFLSFWHEIEAQEVIEVIGDPVVIRPHVNHPFAGPHTWQGRTEIISPIMRSARSEQAVLLLTVASGEGPSIAVLAQSSTHHAHYTEERTMEPWAKGASWSCCDQRARSPRKQTSCARQGQWGCRHHPHPCIQEDAAESSN